MAETTTAHTEAPGGHSGVFPPFNPQTFASQLVWLALAFVVLYVVMSRLALPRIAAIFEARQAKIAADLAEASRLKGEAEAAGAAYEKALADARARAHALASEAHDKIVGEADKSRKAVENRLATRLAEADTVISAARSAAMTHVREIAVDAAAAIVRRLTGVAASDQTVAAAVDTALKR